MSRRPQLFTHGLSGLSQATSANDAQSPAEQRDSAKKNFLKTMRDLPTHHVWKVYFARQHKHDTANKPSLLRPPQDESGHGEYNVQLQQLGSQIESVQAFWRYNNNMPVDKLKMRESIYLFKEGFKPIWEDRRNMHGGSWTFRVSKSIGPEFWNQVQLLAIGEKLEEALDENDQLCGVGFSARFSAHLITIWHRESSKQKSVDGILACIKDNLPQELLPKSENYFYKRHRDHAGFKTPPEAQAVLESGQPAEESIVTEANQPVVKVDPPSAQ
ncbi:eukaryotic initiation factor 4E [Metarhizium robertsii]|uniref:Eukaryotic initiation factor 4E n=1 Tax=Metarhizium robertsii TaxID=568076 RepID=A0A0A1UTV8_9HYPO|nr:eukaryotic initiation factor 4E [Metarhizium robertsii]